MSYCASRFRTIRRLTDEVKVGPVGVGGANPLRIQSMTTSDTQDVAATVRQAVALAEVGCEIVRVTAPNAQAARCLKDIRAGLTAAGFGAVPLVADIHFLPQAAMEAALHVEKVRVNPGNYADKKRFAVRDYSDADYERELQRLHETFSPLVLRCRELGRAMRIGTNHGSLSDRIMNRYGDTPLGMVESALEFLRIAESHGYRSLILSMKASNPKVMIQAYRLLVERMDQEDMRYPLHLGVTEAGDGEDGRIKGAIGIGSLLFDGLGDTIRVSLTEDSVYEIPVARALAEKAMSLWGTATGGGTGSGEAPAARSAPAAETDSLDPYHYARRDIAPLALPGGAAVGIEQPPRVVFCVRSMADVPAALAALDSPRFAETPAEGLLIPVESAADAAEIAGPRTARAASGGDVAKGSPPFLALELNPAVAPAEFAAALPPAEGRPGLLIVRAFTAGEGPDLAAWAALAREGGHLLAIDAGAEAVAALGPVLRALGEEGLIFTLSSPKGEAPCPSSCAPGGAMEGSGHAMGAYRALADQLGRLGLRSPLWIRNTAATAARGDNSFLSRLLEASILTGGLLCDGLGDLVSIETEADPARAVRLAYNVLQGAGARTSKTEFVACPSCGRTLFDLQATTQRIRAQTGHLKGVKIAIMGCIVNGPGEMADADFGYVGGAPGKINLYVGKACVQYNIPQAEADARLVALIREHGKWRDPEFAPA